MKKASFEIMRRDIQAGRLLHADIRTLLVSLKLLNAKGLPVNIRFASRIKAEEALRREPMLCNRQYVIVEVYD